MKDLIKAIDNLPKWVKIILAIPALDIIWCVYRLLRSIDKKNTLGIVLAAVLIAFGFSFLWIIDILCIAFNDKVWWLD
ncbi:MAG: hypothetical protein J6V82_00760 [Clostridia bacterium]|nr:hypothetical protein [Clostridia bacterium]MBO7150260.1 hypothetical protein [Clostridia bacterium]